MDVWDPFAFWPAIIAIQHRGNRIHSEPVGVKALQPMKCARYQKPSDFVAAQIVDEGIPVALVPLARVGVLLERCAVEPR